MKLTWSSAIFIVGASFIAIAVFILVALLLNKYTGIGLFAANSVGGILPLSKTGSALIAIALTGLGFTLVFMSSAYMRPEFSQGSWIAGSVRTIGRFLFDEESHRDWHALLLLLPVAVFSFLYFVTVFPSAATINPDTNSYLNFHIFRPLLYPVFVRLMAVFTDDPYVIVLIQEILGFLAILLFAEMVQRAVRCLLFSLLVGFLLLLSWPLIQMGSAVLSDHLYFSATTLFSGLVVWAVRRGGACTLLLASLCVLVAINIRPIGVSLLIVPVVFAFLRILSLRQLATYFLLPLALVVLLTSSINLMVFGYFGLSKFTGWPMIVNGAYVADEGLSKPDPQMAGGIYEIAKPYRVRYDSTADRTERVRYYVNHTNELAAKIGDSVTDLVRDGVLVPKRTPAPHQKALVEWFNQLSELNQDFGRLGVGASETWIWRDNLMREYSVRAFLSSPYQFLAIYLDKLIVSWFDLFDFHAVPRDASQYFSGIQVLNPELPMLGFETQSYNYRPSDFGRAVEGLFRWVTIPAYILAHYVPLAWLALGAVVISSVQMLQSFHRQRPFGALNVIVITIASIILSYIGLVNLGHVMSSRYALVILPAVLTLGFSPLLMLRDKLVEAQRCA